MCLEKISEKKVAKEDIVVYKFVLEENGKYITPFQETEIKIGETYNSEISIAEKINLENIHKYLNNERYNSNRYINNALHSFKKYLEAVTVIDIFNGKLFLSGILTKYEMVKCIIPKNSIYYEGKYYPFVGINCDWGFDCIASDTIKYVEFIEIKRRKN